MERLIDRLDRFRNVGDAEADWVVGEIERRYSTELLFKLPALVGRWKPGTAYADVPLDVIAYLKTSYDIPDWVDRDAVARAQRRYQKEAQVGQIVLGTYSLPIVFLHPEITVTLMGTGQLMQHTRRRLEETHNFVKVAMAVGALLEPDLSQQWMRKVRLTHAVVRRLDKLKQAPRRSAAGLQPELQHPLQVRHLKRNEALARGLALDQTELSWVLLTFSWAMVDGLQRLGYGLSPREGDDHIHLWALVGHMIGIVDELLPGGPQAPAAAARPLFMEIRSRLLAPGDPFDDILPGAVEARLLMSALVTVLTEVQRHAVPPSLLGWVKRFHWLDAAVQNTPRTIVRRLCGTQAADLLHLGRGPLLYWLVDIVALKLLDLRRWSDPVPEALRRKWFEE